MHRFFSTTLPSLPLLLWETPPGLELILAQEGIAFARVRDPHSLAFQGGRFVLYDGRRVSAARLRATLTPDHVPLDVDLLRGEERADPFQALIDVRGQKSTWRIAGRDLTERVARVPKARLRRLLIERLRHAVTRAGGLWARLAAFPYPYQSAFNFRADLDEPVVEDYARFARMRPTVADCCTHFVSTHAYGEHPAVLQDLLRFDTQPHAHYHVIYHDEEANRRNLLRAHEILTASGFEPVGFAAPHGRWNAGLDAVLEELGYLYSSDFQLGYDDLPFFPCATTGSRKSFRCRSTRSARDCSWRPGSATAAWSPTIWRASSGPRSRRGSPRSSTAIPSTGSSGFPRSWRPWAGRSRATPRSGG